MKRILVAGGAGFIGSHLCQYLLDKGNEVICVDNFITGQKKNLYSLMENKNFEIIRHDINWPLYIEVDEIYNLASPAAPIHYQKDPVQTAKTNVLGSINLLGLAKRLKIKILYTSTSEVYGDPKEHPQKETYWGNVNTLGPRACYDESKRCAETLYMDYHRQNKVEIRLVRIFNTYGPHMAENDGRVISNFVLQALKGQDITIYGDGTQTRSFCYVDDMILGLTKMMDNKDKFLGPVNLGNPAEITIKEIAEKIVDLTNSYSKIIYQPLPQDDPQKRKPDISLAIEKLGWEPKISLEEGIKNTIKYFEKIL